MKKGLRNKLKNSLLGLGLGLSLATTSPGCKQHEKYDNPKNRNNC